MILLLMGFTLFMKSDAVLDPLPECRKITRRVGKTSFLTSIFGGRVPVRHTCEGLCPYYTNCGFIPGTQECGCLGAKGNVYPGFSEYTKRLQKNGRTPYREQPAAWAPEQTICSLRRGLSSPFSRLVEVIRQATGRTTLPSSHVPFYKGCDGFIAPIETYGDCRPGLTYGCKSGKTMFVCGGCSGIFHMDAPGYEERHCGSYFSDYEECDFAHEP